MYWSKESLLPIPVFSAMMRRDRFEYIRKMLQFVDPLGVDHDKPLCKLETFLQILQTQFKTVYIPEQHIAIDEYLALWKGRLKFKVYIPSKRERYGIKIYMFCESHTSYLSDFIVYIGADTVYPEPSITLPKPMEDYSNPSEIVLSLLEGFYNAGYNLAMENLCASPELLRVLFENKTCIWIFAGKKGLPADFWSWKPTKGVGEPPKVKFCNELIICRWNDAYKIKSVKVVSMMSTKHTGKLVDTGKTQFHTKQNILKLDVVHEYSATMGGVDNLSKVVNPHNMQRKGSKWYRKLA